MSTSSPIICYCSCPNDDTARQLARILIEEHLAACVHILPSITSLYSWNDRLCEDKEVLLIIKSTQGKFPTIQTRVIAHHPYELPELIAVDIEQGYPPYLQWITQQTHETQS